MAKTNIVFNNTNYSIDDSSLSSAVAELRSHLSTVMNGSGATINFGGTAYNVDSAKLSAATNEFVSHLGTIAGSGHKVTVNDVEYGIDSAKVAGAISELESVFGGVGEERLEGDGAEYYTLAPTALSFRSTAPLNELQEVQINGVTVDPANYSLEEGSTIVTFPIEYLKTLDVGNYEVAVASESKSVKGGFEVKAPELNSHGFYYNQPYTAYVAPLGAKIAFFVRENGTFDSIVIGGAIETGTYEISGNSIVSNNSLGTLHSTISDDGTEIYCTEIATSFVLGDESVVADEDFIYAYKEELNGYEVTPIDRTKAEYGAIKTGINGIDTVALMAQAFENNINMTVVPELPQTLINIGDEAFRNCTSLTSIDLSMAEIVGEWVFYGCTNLQSVDLRNVTVIGNVFGNCTNLHDINLSSITTIPDSLLQPCTNLFYINLSSMTILPDDLFRDHANLCSVDISRVKTIGNYTFYGCNKLTRIDLSGVETIGRYAFSNCYGLSKANLSNVTSISNNAFDGCRNLSIVYLSKLETIGSNVFYNCTDASKNLTIYYSGTKEQLYAIVDSTNNTIFFNGMAYIYYNYTGE